MKTSFVCNGRKLDAEAPPDRLLVDVLRDDIGLTGTKLGCGTGDCGACTVLLDGRPVNACLVLLAECDGAEITTVEGVAETPVGKRVVNALVEHHAVQCGICTPGFVVTATAYVESLESRPSRPEIQEAIAGNLCRCTGYFPIIAAIESAIDGGGRD